MTDIATAERDATVADVINDQVDRDSGQKKSINSGKMNEIILGIVTPRLMAIFSTVDPVYTNNPDDGGGADNIAGDADNDLILGGAEGDTMAGNGGEDIVIGDHARVTYSSGIVTNVVSEQHAVGGSDSLSGGDQDDVLIGGAAGDVISGDANNDILLGDNAEINFVAGTVSSIETIARTIGGADIMRGNSGEDILIGGAFGDQIDGGSERDLIFGDNVMLDRTAGVLTNPRYRELSGEQNGQLYSTETLTAGDVLVTADAQLIPEGAPVWEDFDINVLDHDNGTQTAGLSNFGNDYIAGGADNDQIFAQLGDDIVQGDGSIDISVSALRDSENNLVVSASVDNLATDGDDYIEGNGGNDVIFGNLGQDDIIGGSSELFSLATPERRPDGSDLLFGGSGTAIARLDAGDQTVNAHANDADMLLGDNGNIFRIVATNDYVEFEYDQTSSHEDRGDNRIIVRAAELLDYTPGGVDVDSNAVNDIGAADEIHGEAGDDFIYGMKGDDVVFGEGQDDDIIGGYGNDWISGGNGQDGILGDDGRIFTSRNGTVEELAGVTVATVQSTISTPGKVQQADINVTGELKKAVDLTPFSQDTSFNATQDEFGGESKHTSDDIIYGGLGSDFIHAGSGDDAVSGAEALPEFYANPNNPGDVLGYDTNTTEFAEYDEYAPRTQIENFLLNFDPTEGDPVVSATYGVVQSDGDDVIFGDLGNDWLVGGSGRDNMYGGWGDDLLNADDDQGVAADENNAPDTHPSYEDRAYGGAGRDVLIGNTGGDRLIDWVGEFNSYIVPFAPFGIGTVSRTLQPQLADFLLDLSASDGVDMTRAADTGADAARNGEPFGELGMVRQQDFAWQDQTGAPRDPQAGNLAGGKRDVLRSASFDDVNAAAPLNGFAVDSGTWEVSGGALQVSAESLQDDAVSVFHIEDALPSYYEIQSTVEIIKPTAGWKADAYLIFDYINETDFKFAGINDSTNKLEIGHRDAAGWHVDTQTPFQVKHSTPYNLTLAVNGLNATLVVNNQVSISKTFDARVVDDYAYGLNWGLIGIGSDRSRGSFDNIQVQVLAPEATTIITDEFESSTGELFNGQTASGNWQVADERLSVDNAGGEYAMSFGQNVGAQSILSLNAVLSADDQAGFIFDQYSAEDYKFVMLDVSNQQVLIGHRTAQHGIDIDSVASHTLLAGQDYELKVMLKGTTVSVELDNQAIAGYVYNAVALDAGFALQASAAASVDSVTVSTNDIEIAQLHDQPQAMLAAETATVTVAGDELSDVSIADLKQAAVSRWAESVNAQAATTMTDVEVTVADLPDQQLGVYRDGQIVLDSDAAGHGWFVDQTPATDEEYQPGGNALQAAGGDAAQHMDALSVLTHELGHAVGLTHTYAGVMNNQLDVGERLMPSAETDQQLLQLAVAAELDAMQPAMLTSDTATVPTVDLSTGYFDQDEDEKSTGKPAKSDWKDDFVNHLGQNDAERNPNAGLRVNVSASTSVSS